MVLFLLKRDDPLKVALAGALLAPLVLLSRQRGWSGALGFLQVVTFMVLMCAVQLRLAQRTTRFEVALPITGRQLFLARMIGTLLAIWVPIGAAVVLLLITRREGGLFLIQGAAVLTLAATVPLTARLREAAIARGVSAALFFSAIAVGAATWFLLPQLAHLALFTALSAALLVRACLTVPGTFEVSPRQAAAYRPSNARRGLRRPAWWLMWRSAFPWLAFVLFALGIFTGWLFPMAITTWFFVVQAGLLSRDGTRWLQSLPLSHRTLLALTLAATVIPSITGSVIGTWIVRPSFIADFVSSRPTVGGMGPYGSHKSLISYSATNVSLGYWRWAPGGNVPVIRAPWGETVHPPPVSILGLTFYNPYACAYNPWWTQRGDTSANRNSERFFEWQYENTTQNLFGQRITFSQYDDAIERASAGTGSEDPTLRQVLQTMRQVDRMLSLNNDPGKTRLDILTLAAILFWLLAGAFLRELALWHSPRWSILSARSLPILAALPLVAYFSLDMFYQFRVGLPVLAPLAHLLLRSISALLPQNPVALAAIAALPSLGMYWLLEGQFAKSEMTAPLIWRRTETR